MNQWINEWKNENTNARSGVTKSLFTFTVVASFLDDGEHVASGNVGYS